MRYTVIQRPNSKEDIIKWICPYCRETQSDFFKKGNLPKHVFCIYCKVRVEVD